MKFIALLIFSLLLVSSPLERSIPLLCLYLIGAISIKLPLKQYHRELRFFLVLGMLIAITEWLSTQSIIATIAAPLAFLTIILGGIIFADSTAPDDISRSLGRVLDCIPGVKGYKAAYHIELTLSIIPMIFDAAFEIREAQSARSGRSFRRPIRTIVVYTSGVFQLLLDRMDELEAALTARLFNPAAKRESFPWSWRDIVFGLVIITPVILVVTLQA